jgi:ribosome maturation protein Sdo1
MLSDREKFVLHFVAMITIARITKMPHSDKLIHKMIEDVRCNRCRSIAPEDVHELLEEINEELVSGELMLKHVMEDTIWSMTGERPNKNTNWNDMK